MKKNFLGRIGMAAALLLFPLNHALALESQGESIHLDTMKSLTINRSMLARFQTEAASLSHAENALSSDLIKRRLANLQYKIKALDEDNKKLVKALSQSSQANESLKDVIAKAQTPPLVSETAAPSEKNGAPRASPGSSAKADRENVELHERALQFVAKKELEKAIKLYEEIILVAPNDDEAYLIMGHCLVLTGEFKKAEEAFRNAGHINRQNLFQILPFYENLIRQNPDDADAYVNLGFVCLMFGDTRRAQNSFQQALALNAENRTALRGLQIIENYLQNRSR